MFPTHRSNNTLDLVFTECLGTQRILGYKPGPYLSDHAAVEFLLSVEKEHMVSKHVTTRKLKSMDIPSFIVDLQLEDQLDSDRLDDMVEWLETKLQTALDKHAPSKEKCITDPPIHGSEIKLKIKKGELEGGKRSGDDMD